MDMKHCLKFNFKGKLVDQINSWKKCSKSSGLERFKQNNCQQNGCSYWGESSSKCCRGSNDEAARPGAEVVPNVKKYPKQILSKQCWEEIYSQTQQTKTEIQLNNRRPNQIPDFQIGEHNDWRTSQWSCVILF